MDMTKSGESKMVLSCPIYNLIKVSRHCHIKISFNKIVQLLIIPPHSALIVLRIVFFELFLNSTSDMGTQQSRAPKVEAGCGGVECTH